MLEVISKETEHHRLRFYRSFVITFSMVSLAIFFGFFFTYFIILSKLGGEEFDKEAKKIIFTNIKSIKHLQHEVIVYEYTEYGMEFYDFCRTIWSFKNMYEKKLEIMLDNTPITIAEVKLTYNTPGSKTTHIRFNGTIIKIKTVPKSKILPFRNYQLYNYRGETYIVVYEPKKILNFDLFIKVSKESFETKISNFINILSSLK